MFNLNLNFLSKPVSPSNIKHNYNVLIEQYRGLCSLLVLLGHAFSTDFMVKNYKFPGFANYLGAGFLSVLVFFCISGYVIGITNNNAQMNVGSYLKKRAIRLWPIYLFSIVLSILTVTNINVPVLLGNIFFLQNSSPYFGLSIPVFVNFAAWSLNYEVVYYLFFIFIFFVRPKLWKILAIMMLLTIVLLHFPEYLEFLNKYNNYFYFWLLGLLFAWGFFPKKIGKPQIIPLISIIFLHLCLNHLGVGEMVMHILGIYHSYVGVLFNLIFCLMVMGKLTNSDNLLLKINNIVCYLMPFFVFAYLLHQHRIFEDTRWVMSLIFWVLSLLFLAEKRLSEFLLDKLTGLGQISYSLYLLHIPIALLIRNYINIEYRPIELFVKYFLWLTFTIGLSILLEIYCQPLVRKYYFRTVKPT